MSKYKRAAILYVFYLFVLFANSIQAAPFFDNDPTTRLAPQFPAMSELDKEVLQLCGDWGSHINKLQFQKFIRKHASSPWFVSIRSQLHEEKGSSINAFSYFSKLWLEKDGFAHVFCGEPGVKRLGGLHYFPRYWQAQQNNWASLADGDDRRLVRYCKGRNVVAAGDIYTVPVVWRTSRNRKRIKCLASYHLEMNAEEIFLAASLASLRVQSTAGKYVCIEKLEGGAGYDGHYSLLVLSKQSLITWYPMTVKQYQKQKRKGIAHC